MIKNNYDSLVSDIMNNDKDVKKIADVIKGLNKGGKLNSLIDEIAHDFEDAVEKEIL